MRILFLSYWGAHEGLTAATVIPHLNILSANPSVEKIIFCSIEREGVLIEPMSWHTKIVHVPLFSISKGSIFLNKWRDFREFPKQLIEVCHDYRIDIIFCRSSLAGALGYRIYRGTGIPYIVESFEPHADYMYDSKIWPKYDPRLWIQRYFEKQIRKTARLMLPVSTNFENKLLGEGISKDRVLMLPCCISLDDFQFKPNQREVLRTKWGLTSDDVVGIYVGKFGGIYFEEESFALYRSTFDYFGKRFFLVILTADSQALINRYMAQFRLPQARIMVLKAAHQEVPNYLSAADFAFSTIKPARSRKYCSPIKNGEYWANGLPILLEDGIGDDSDILRNEGGGFLLDMKNPAKAFHQIDELLKRGRSKIATKIQPIAFKHRRLELIMEAYQKILNQFS